MIISAWRFRCQGTGKTATVAHDGLLRQYDDNKLGRQRFILHGSGASEISSRAFTNNRVLDAAGGDPSVPTYIQLYSANGGANQHWRIEDRGTIGAGTSGYYVKSIHADDTDLVWDVPYNDPSDGNYIQTYPWNGGNNQLWVVEHKEIEAVVIRNQHSGWVLDVPGFEQHTAYIQHHPANGGFNQFWEIIKLPGITECKIRSASSGRFLTSSIVTVDDDALVFQAGESGSDKQLWKITTDAAGMSSIQNKDTGFFLGVPPGPVTTAKRVICTAGSSGPEKQWELVP